MTCSTAHRRFWKYARVAAMDPFATISRGASVAARSLLAAGVLLSLPSSMLGAAAPSAPVSGLAAGRAELRERTLRSIVGIRVARAEPRLAFKGRFKVTADVAPAEGSGSGIVVDASGLLLTCAHVLGSQGRARVFLPGGREAGAVVAIVDPATDLALLKVEGPAAGLTPLDLRPAPRLRQGGVVFLAARPGGSEARFSEETLAAEGAVHAGHSDLEFLRQFLGDVEPGDSGGALVDEEGRLVGVLSAGVPQGRVGYAIARELVLLTLARMRAGAPVVWPWIGAGVESAPEGFGARVWSVAKGSPAERSGLRTGDRIVALDGRPVEHFLPAMMAVVARPVGTPFRLSVQRAGDGPDEAPATLKVASAPRPLEPEFHSFELFLKLTGIRLGVERAPDGAEKVVVLEDTASEGPGAAMSPNVTNPTPMGPGRGELQASGPLRAGWRLVSVLPGLGVVQALEEGRNDREVPIDSADDLGQALRAAKIGNTLTAVFVWADAGRRQAMLLSGEARRLPAL